MSDNVHGHQMPQKQQHLHVDNPIFAREQPETTVAEIPQGLHGAPQLRSETEPETSPAGQAQEPSPIAEAGTVYVDSDGKPIGVSDGTKVVPLDITKAPMREDGLPFEDDEKDEDQTTTDPAVSVAAVPVPAQDTAIEAADQKAHDAAVAADQAAMVADDAAANADEVRSS